MLVVMTTNTAEAHLLAFGFTETEARVYCELLKGGPATGYRLAQGVGKAAANVYQALAALSQKGAVIADDGEAKSYRPVPPAELLAALERDFAARRQAAAETLAALHQPAADDRLYHLKSAGQVLEAARALIAGAREIVLFDLFPAPLAQLRPDFEAAAARGVTVAGKAYGQAPERGPLEIVVQDLTGLLDRWPGQQVTVVADASAHLVALLSRDGGQVLNGVWSDSAYLACLQHSSLSAEIRLARAAPEGDDPLARLSLLSAQPPGLRRLTGAAQA